MALARRITTMTDNGAPPGAAVALYPGEVMHARMKPFSHRFTYKVFSLLIDLDRLEEAGRASPLFRVNRAGLLSFHEADHAEIEGEGLRAMADRLLAKSGLAEPAARILLLAYPRMLGYVFNPISVFFAYGRDGGLLAVIYRVRNTFGERHSYVAKVEEGELSEAGLRQQRTKIFHVSPFIPLGARYNFRILPPGKAVRVRIHETEAGEPLLAATFVGEEKAFTTASLLRALARTPLMTWKVVYAIHWQALKIWLKGATFHTSPPPPEPVSFHDQEGAFRPGE
ncbi:DUF1365 family protein [Chelativorans sp. ZYF759]|uniref:DUF1365 domain-containing protein n=1 Tax=Chelativorans sp. ZYF759 TaxID=2692213 RepID=UPI00145E8127|nr:DUF1365 domain-containing protein [Chelativorans sp. ZYF759]NMG38644.1 DUF1365 family protein [Chelativorans sp. ZYF759]